MNNVHDLGMLADTLNELIERAEAMLDSYRTSATISVSGLGGRPLSFCKVNQGWRLVLDEDHKLVAELSIGVRLAVANAIPLMFDAMRESQCETIDRLRTAIHELESYLDGLNVT